MIGGPKVPIQPSEKERFAVAIRGINGQDMGMTIFPDRRTTRHTFKVAHKITCLAMTIEQIANPDVLQRLQCRRPSKLSYCFYDAL